MAEQEVPHLVSDGDRQRCSVCSQVFKAKSPESLKTIFAVHIRISHQKLLKEQAEKIRTGSKLLNERER